MPPLELYVGTCRYEGYDPGGMMHLRRSDVISSDFGCCSIVNSAIPFHDGAIKKLTKLHPTDENA